MTMDELEKICEEVEATKKKKVTKQLNELSELRNKTVKLSRKFHKLTMKLRSTEAYDRQFKKMEYAEDAFHRAVEWINKEIEYQTDSLVNDETD